MKSKKIKIHLNENQKLILNTLSNEHRQLYNHLLNFIKTNKTSDFKLINEEYVNYRNSNNLTINSKSAQNTSRTLIQNIKSFFALHKKDKSHNFPYKFKSRHYFTTFIYDFNNGMGGFKIKDNKLIIQKGLLTIDLPSYCSDITENNVKTVVFKNDNNDFENYNLVFVYSETNTNHLVETDKENFMSIDIGVTDLVTAHSNKISNFKIATEKFKTLEKQVENIQSKRDLRNKKSIKFKKYQKRYKFLRMKLTNKRKNWLHKITTKLVKLCQENNIGQVIVGDIKVKKLKDSNVTNKGLNKSTQNLYLSRFKTFLDYKLKNAYIAIDFINEAFTSQINCLTDKKEFNSDLSVRTVRLNDSLEIDRDLNSAVNIAKRFLIGKWLPCFLNVNLERMLLDEQYLINLSTGEAI